MKNAFITNMSFYLITTSCWLFAEVPPPSGHHIDTDHNKNRVQKVNKMDFNEILIRKWGEFLKKFKETNKKLTPKKKDLKDKFSDDELQYLSKILPRMNDWLSPFVYMYEKPVDPEVQQNYFREFLIDEPEIAKGLKKHLEFLRDFKVPGRQLELK